MDRERSCATSAPLPLPASLTQFCNPFQDDVTHNSSKQDLYVAVRKHFNSMVRAFRGERCGPSFFCSANVSTSESCQSVLLVLGCRLSMCILQRLSDSTLSDVDAAQYFATLSSTYESQRIFFP
jgi:hypothetical protein